MIPPARSTPCGIPPRIGPQQLLRQRLQIRLQPRHALGLLGQRVFVHVQLAVDLQLDAVAVLGWGAVAAHQFHAFVGVVVFHAVAARAQVLAHQG